MTREEWAVLVASLRTMYTSSNFLADEDAFNLWYTFLHDIDYKLASAAVQKYICENKFPPTVADIRSQVATILNPIQDWSQGWSEVLTAITKFGYYNEADALASMSPNTRETVKRLGWQNICTSSNITADRARFQEIFDQITARRKKESALPIALNKRVAEIRENTKRLELTDGIL